MGDQYDRVLIRLSSAEDDKLEGILAKLLPLVFDELLTQTEAPLRLKIVNVLNHVLTRAKGNAAVKLPTQAILERWFSPQLATSAGAPFFRNLSIIFLDLSVPRLSPEEQIDLAMYALEHFGELQPAADRATVFMACIAGLGHIAAEGKRKEQVPRCLAVISARPEDDVGLVAFFRAAAEFLLIPCGAAEAPSVGGMPSASWAFWKARLKAKTVPDMVALKTSVLRWLGALAASAPASLVYLPSLVATVENYDAVCNLAESNCKRLDPELDMAGDPALVGRLICSALTSAPPGREDAIGALRVEPKATVPAKLRTKVLTLLQRSKAIGRPDLVPHVVHLICQSLREAEQVQTAALQLALVLAEHIEDDVCLCTAAASILQGIEDVFWPGGGVVAMGPATPLAFRTYGGFARALGEHPTGSGRALALQGAPRMLALLASNEGAAQDILEALTGLVACMRGPDESEYRGFVPLLDRLVIAPRPVVRREVLRWASTLFPASAPEGRYYALRLLGDSDPDIARAAEALLSSGGREAPRFEDMCSFLAARALGLNQGGGLDRLQAQARGVREQPPSLPNLSSSFSERDVARALSFLLGLAGKEGLRSFGEEAFGASPPAAKRPRLSGGSAGGDASAAESVGDETGEGAVAAFLALLDYLLIEVVNGASAASTEVDEALEGMTRLELALRCLLLAGCLAGSRSALLSEVGGRAELVLVGSEGRPGTLFREGGAAANRARRLGARVVGALCAPRRPGAGADGAGAANVCEAWLAVFAAELDAPAGTARRAGAVLAVSEMLRADVCGPRSAELCKKAVGMLSPGAEEDSAVLAAVCEGLRRLSERRPLVWEVLDAESGGADGAAEQRKAALDRLYGLSRAVTGGLGDTKEAELGVGARELVHSSWRLLGQLAAWGGEGSADCVDRLVAIGLKCPGEEALGALGLALAAAASEPTASTALEASGGSVCPDRADALLRKLLVMSGVDEAEPSGPPTNDAARAELVETETRQRCAVVWLTVLLRRIAQGGLPTQGVVDCLEPLCRAFVRAVAGLSIFVADCATKALCYLYCLAPAECRVELMKTMFSSISNRTVVSNMFVGAPDTAARKEVKDKIGMAGPNSLKMAAKERVDLLKDLMFLARELSHPPLFAGLLDQPAGSVWTGEVLREALDLQEPCMPSELHAHLCPEALRPKLYPFFFHPNGPLRQAVVALAASYFSVESPQQLASKFPKEWPLIAKNLVSTLGSSRVSTREASVHAAQVLFRGQTWPDIAFVFEEYWTIVVKLMDDMEERIQVLVKPLVRMTRNLTLRLCDAKLGKPKDVEEAIKVIIPLLLLSCERHKHAQPLCFDVIREMVKAAHGTPLLSPYVQDLIPPLLVSLSMMEHSSLQYWQFHVDQANEEKGKELEAARISNSRDSESMKLLRQLVPLVTPENALEIAPRTRDSLARGVGANTRVGVCDFWVCVCAERPVAVPTGGTVATSMLRSCAGALLDPNREVRNAAAGCFASLARRNEPQELARIVSERLLQQDAEFRTDDVQRNAFRVSLARALWEVCRRCDDAALLPELKSGIAAKAFVLRWSSDQEVKTGWESLWGELCPTTSGGVEKYYRDICAELVVAFADNISRAEKASAAKAASALATQLDKQLPRPHWGADAAVLGVHKAILAAVQASPVFDGSGAVVRALADVAATMYRRKRNETSPTGRSAADEASLGFPLIQAFACKGGLADRAAAVRALSEVMSATRLWAPLAEVAQLHASASARVDELQLEVEAEKREPGEAVPKRHRGKGQSPAEELLSATLDLWAMALQQCRREVEDEGDMEPPEASELRSFFAASLAEFEVGSLTMRLGVVRLWKHVLGHLQEERIAASGLLDDEVCVRILAWIQDASLDARSERLRRPALELAEALVTDAAPGGGREVLTRGFAAGSASTVEGTPVVMPFASWYDKVDDATAELCRAPLDALRKAFGEAEGAGPK